jgi:uncharacterized membrane protein HdeD (DUF308 family)
MVVLAQWPISGLWASGTFVGIDLLFQWITWIKLPLGLRAIQ